MTPLAPVLAALLAANASVPPAAPAGVRWEPSWSAALQKAKATRKPVMVDFWAEWCGFCHRLDRTTYRDPEVTRATRDFVAVKVNTEGAPADAETASRYVVRSLPTILFVSPEGRPFLRLNGYLPPQHFFRALQEAQRRAGEVIQWESALSKDPKDVAALTELGLHQFSQLTQMAERDEQQLMSKAMFDDVQSLLTRAYKLDTGRPAADRKRLRIALGLLQGYGGKFAPAEAMLKEAIAIAPASDPDAKAHITLGEIYMMQDKKDLARAEFKLVANGYAGTEENKQAHTYLRELGGK